MLALASRNDSIGIPVERYSAILSEGPAEVPSGRETALTADRREKTENEKSRPAEIAHPV